MKLQKFENVDVIASLEAIMKQGSIIHGGFTGNRPAILSLPMRWN